MKSLVTAFGVGVLFALGLGIAGMTLPEKVIGFLDVGGNWDPSLAFVMGGAVLVYAIGFRLTRRRMRPLFDPQFRLPTRREITPSLVTGAALFGIGWGIAGFCPGPAVTSLATGSPKVLLFISAMIGGMYAHKLFDKVLSRSAEAKSAETPAPALSTNVKTD